MSKGLQLWLWTNSEWPIYVLGKWCTK